MRLAAMAALAFLPGLLQAQQAEARMDAVWTDRVSWQLGGGLTWAAGNYARISAVAGYAIGDGAGSAYRGELIGRLAFDPFRRRRAGFSIGGGLGLSDEPYLVAVAELEGPVWGRVTPAIQFGASRGYRAGLILRAARENRR